MSLRYNKSYNEMDKKRDTVSVSRLYIKSGHDKPSSFVKTCLCAKLDRTLIRNIFDCCHNTVTLVAVTITFFCKTIYVHFSKQRNVTCLFSKEVWGYEEETIVTNLKILSHNSPRLSWKPLPVLRRNSTKRRIGFGIMIMNDESNDMWKWQWSS
jgi:hypothetical protein